MHILTRFSLRRASIIVMLMVLVVLGGIYSAGRLRSELLPNIDLPVVSVVAVYPGAAPDDVRRDVTEPIEKAIAGTANLKNLTSSSSDSVAFISAEYEYGTNMDKTQQSIQDAVNQLMLPSQVQRPTVGRFNFQDIPVIAYTINTNDNSADALVNLRKSLNEKLIPDLKAIPGVNSVALAGGGTKQVVITFDDKKLQQHNVTASSITGLLQANNISFPTGSVVTGGQSIPVRVENQFNTVEDLQNLVVKAASSGASSGSGAGAQNGQPAKPSPAVKLSDVATVALANTDAESISRSNGKPSLSLIVYKTQNSNTVQVAQAVNSRILNLKNDVTGSQAVVLFDQSTYIQDSLNGLIREGILGALLAIVVILLFLRNIKSTLVTAFSIPLSVLIALILLNVFSISLNIMSLAGLAVAIGRVVDDSIVVLENIYRHHFQRGEPLREAAFKGTKEVATAITASTITTVCVFLPLGLIAGLVSEFFKPFAVAVSVSLLASLVVALTVIPVLSAFFLRNGKFATAVGRMVSRTRTPRVHPAEERSTFVQRVYTPTIEFLLKNTWTRLGTVAVALLLFVGSMALVPYIGTSFLNFGSDKVLNATVTMKPGTDLATTDKAAQAIESDLQKNSEVSNYQTTLGSNTQGAGNPYGGAGGNASTAKLTITLQHDADVNQQADWLRGIISSHSKGVAISDFSVTTGSGAGPSSSGFSAVVSGSNPDDVNKTSAALVARLKPIPDLVNVTSDAASAKPEIHVKVDPARALEHGSTTIQIATQVRNLLTSQKVTQITIGGQSYDVQATYDQSTLDSLEQIKAIKVGNTNPVPLSEVADVTEGNGPVSITHVNQELAVTVKGTITSSSTNGVTAAAQKAIDSLKPGPGTKVSITGVSQQQSESFGQLGVALLVSVVLVYMVMVLTFGSLSTPFIIMFSLPLAAIGSITALFITGRPLGISALIGVLMLVGIVVTNAIVLLDLVEQYKHRGYSTHDALVQGGRTRVRPILMTAIATMVALMPLVLGFSEGSIIASELGTVVVGGLFSSTFLTLIVVPVVYSLLDSVRSRLGGNKSEDVLGMDRDDTEVHLDDIDRLAPPEPVGAR